MTTSIRDYSHFMETARRRAKVMLPHDISNHTRAWRVARRAATFVKERYPAAVIRAFGSLLYPDSFRTRSDIDLAVEGVPWSDYLRVWGSWSAANPYSKLTW